MLGHGHVWAAEPHLGGNIVDLGLAVHATLAHKGIHARRRGSLAPEHEAAEVDARRRAHATASKRHGCSPGPRVGTGVVDLNLVGACTGR